MKKNVTLKDVAAVAGLSTAAVSKALRGEKDIGQETQERVNQIAKSLGYCTNNLAIYLRNGSINAIGVLMPDNSNPYNALVLQGLEEKAKELGYNVIIGNTSCDPDREKALLKTFISMKVAGILAIPISLENYQCVSLPLIIMSRFPYMEPYAGMARAKLAREFNYIVNDDFAGEYLAAEHLIKRGFRNIYLILSRVNPETVEGVMNLTRLAGFQKALSDYGLPFSQDHVISDIQGMHESYGAVTTLLSSCEGPVGLCMNTDYLAMAALSAIHDRGLRIPDQVGIVGYDDIDTAKYAIPALTTINQAKYLIGSQSAIHVVSSHYSNEITWKKVLKPTLVVRRST